MSSISDFGDSLYWSIGMLENDGGGLAPSVTCSATGGSADSVTGPTDSSLFGTWKCKLNPDHPSFAELTFSALFWTLARWQSLEGKHGATCATRCRPRDRRVIVDPATIPGGKSHPELQSETAASKPGLEKYYTCRQSQGWVQYLCTYYSTYLGDTKKQRIKVVRSATKTVVKS